MAPLPVENTARTWIDYETSENGVEHTIMVRSVAGATPAEQTAQQFLSVVLAAFGGGSFRQGWRCLRARHAAAGSDVAFPVPLVSFLATFVGLQATPLTPTRETLEGRLVGRGLTSGRRVSIGLYGWSATIDPGNFRVVAAASPAFALLVQTAVNQANADVNAGRTVAGDRPLWYPYLNFNYNSYWERRLRLS